MDGRGRFSNFCFLSVLLAFSVTFAWDSGVPVGDINCTEFAHILSLFFEVRFVRNKWRYRGKNLKNPIQHWAYSSAFRNYETFSFFFKEGHICRVPVNTFISKAL